MVPNTLRYILWTVFSFGMLVIAFTFFWVFLIILGIVIIARLIYFKLFKKGHPGTGGFTIHTYTMRSDPMNYPPGQENEYTTTNQKYLTVIDADDPDQEYKIPNN